MDDVVLLLQRYQALTVPRESGDVFMQHLTQRMDSWFVEIGDVGLAYLTDIVPEHNASLHVLFWDERLGAQRVLAVRAALQKAFELFALARVTVPVVAEGKPARIYTKFLTRIGFLLEGTIRNGVRKPEGGYADILLYGLLPEETKQWQ